MFVHVLAPGQPPCTMPWSRTAAPLPSRTISGSVPSQRIVLRSVGRAVPPPKAWLAIAPPRCTLLTLPEKVALSNVGVTVPRLTLRSIAPPQFAEVLPLKTTLENAGLVLPAAVETERRTAPPDAPRPIARLPRNRTFDTTAFAVPAVLDRLSAPPPPARLPLKTTLLRVKLHVGCASDASQRRPPPLPPLPPSPAVMMKPSMTVSGP